MSNLPSELIRVFISLSVDFSCLKFTYAEHLHQIHQNDRFSIET